MLILAVFPLYLYAGGQKEDAADSARALMDQRRWDEAILVIKDLMVNEPSRFDEGQLLIQQIMINKKIYNDYFQRLVDAYLQGDLELAYAVIGEMEAQDPFPNPRTKELIVEARATAGVIATKSRFDAIMARAKAAIDEGRLYDAIDIYLSGSDIARDLFGDLALGNIVENQVDGQNRRVAELVSSVKNLRGQTEGLIARTGDLNFPQEPVQEDLNDILNQIAAITEQMDSLNGLYSELVDISIAFLVYHDQLQEAHNLEKDIYHLKYIAYLYSGRPSAEEFEGITGVIDRLTSEIIDPLESGAFEMVSSVYEQGLDSFTADNFTTADAAFALLGDTLELYYQSLSGWTSRAVLDPRDGSLWRGDLRSYGGLTARTAFVQALEDILVLYRRAAALGTGYDELVSQPLNDENDYQAARERLSGLTSQLQGLFPGNDIPRLAPLFEDTRIADAVQGFLNEKQRLLARFIDRDIRFEDERIRLAVAGLEQRVAEGEQRIEEGARAISGYLQNEEEGGLFIRDPRGAKDLLTSQLSENAEITDVINDEITRIRSNPDYITGTDAVRDHLAVLETLRGRIAAVNTEIEDNNEQADEYLFQAQRYAQEGDDYFQEARTLLERGEFDRAKQRVEDVAERYDQALSFQTDAAIRQRRDNELPALYDEIINEQKQFIIQEVRTLITEGRTNYSNGDFVAAESVLLRAQSRYSEVSVEPEPEVEYWLTLAQTALSINSGREILPVDPLYPEMTQLLNLAKADYNAARAEFERGNRTRALNLLDQAELRIQTIQQPFPQNQEASLLFLRILQLRDPGQFDSIFAERFANARSKLSTNPEEGYIELKDLQAIRPDYRGMNEAIFQAEIATGIRVPPPDTTRLRRAQELYSQALTIVRGNVTAQFPIALSALNEAIRLNPDYIDAIRLKDRIQSSGTGIAGATAILSARDQALYEEAVNAYQNGLYRQAQLIVDRLLVNEDNQRNTRLLDLKERIQSKL